MNCSASRQSAWMGSLLVAASTNAFMTARGVTFGDVVHMFVFRTRPRIGDLGRASAVINSYFAPYNHKPTSTNLVVLELGEPEQLIEIQMVAVVN